MSASRSSRPVFSLSRQGVGVRVAIAAGMVVVVWAMILGLVL